MLTMIVLLSLLFILPTTTALVATTLGRKINNNTTHLKAGHILTWSQCFCCAWIAFSIVVLLNLSYVPDNLMKSNLIGKLLEATVVTPIFISTIATIGAAVFSIYKRLYTAHAFASIIMCMSVIWLLFSWSSTIFG